MVKDILIGRILRGITDREDFSLASWPEPDIGALAPKALDLFLRRKEAVLMYLQGSDGAAISAATGVHPRFVNRTIRERCMHPHPDGRVYGWRGLIPGLHIAKYHRKSKIGVDAKGGGVAGEKTRHSLGGFGRFLAHQAHGRPSCASVSSATKS